MRENPPYKVQYLHFRYLKFLVKQPRTLEDESLVVFMCLAWGLRFTIWFIKVLIKVDCSAS